ncbi:hypothetical protein [Rhizosphaericola mali]|uniref:Sulfotransferase family protein n=1 Tax=Rhizosphaericola mali TaxID=2545455 RepID=A0A5P2G693_9BACT|nr:hypothetical protein [Rhizosphaericola mali]QES90208.1 hypothetical protein E0W69_016640 [Rhizosphaericola mali]
MANFVVIGMARSGTSFLSSWLHNIGIKMGEEFLPADKIMNEKGFFEDANFHKIQLKLQNLNPDIDLEFLRKTKSFKLKCEESQFKEGVNLILKKQSQDLDWGWKVTAETYRALSSFWIPVFSFTEKISTPNFLVAFRHFNLTVASLMRVKYLKRREKSAFDGWKLKWLSYNKSKYANYYLKEWIEANREILNCKKEYKKFQFLFIDTHFLLKNGERIFEKLNNISTNQLKYLAPTHIYDKELMDRPAPLKYKFDPNLVLEAEYIYKELLNEMHNQNL